MASEVNLESALTGMGLANREELRHLPALLQDTLAGQGAQPLSWQGRGKENERGGCSPTPAVPTPLGKQKRAS